MGWRAAVAGAALVLTVALTAGGLYRSSVATAALQREVRDVCPADAGLSITAAPAPGPRVDFARTSLNALAASVPGTDAPVIVEQTSSAAASIEGRSDTHDVVV